MTITVAMSAWLFRPCYPVGSGSQLSYFISRRASSAQAGSLSLSHNGMAARNSSRAAVRLPALSASLPSSRCARPWTHLRPSTAIARFRSAPARPRPSQRGARGAALVAPERVFAEHPRPPVVGEPREALVQEALGVRRAAGAQQRRSALEPHQPVARIVLAQHRQLLQRVVVPLLAVVEQDEREPRVGLVVAAVGGGALRSAAARARVRRRSRPRRPPSAAAATASRRCSGRCRR